jgi:HK97 family phage portal protein
LTADSVKQWFINWAQGVGTPNADKLSAYFAAKRVIAEDVSKIPGGVVEVDGDTRTPLPNHPVRKLLWKQPNPTMLPVAFKELLISWAIDSGGGIAEIVQDGNGIPTQLWPIHPSRVTLNSDDPTRPFYLITNNDGSQTELEQEDVFHLQGFSKDGLDGYSLLGIMNEVLGFGLEIQRFGTAFLQNNGVPPMVITPKDGSITKDKLEEIRKSWKEKYSGSKNVGKTAWLQRPVEIQTFDINQETQQLLENKKFTVVDIARFMRVNPDKLMDWENASGGNQEQSATSHIDNIMSWFVRWEQEAERKLFTPEEQAADNLEVKFRIAALLRADVAARAAFYREMFGIGAFSQNDILRLEDLNPIPDGDNHFVQGAMIPLQIYQEWIDGERDGLQGSNTNQNNIPMDNNNGNGNASAAKVVQAAIMESHEHE